MAAINPRDFSRYAPTYLGKSHKIGSSRNRLGSANNTWPCISIIATLKLEALVSSDLLTTVHYRWIFTGPLDPVTVHHPWNITYYIYKQYRNEYTRSISFKWWQYLDSRLLHDHSIHWNMTAILMVDHLCNDILNVLTVLKCYVPDRSS